MCLCARDADEQIYWETCQNIKTLSFFLIFISWQKKVIIFSRLVSQANRLERHQLIIVQWKMAKGKTNDLSTNLIDHQLTRALSLHCVNCYMYGYFRPIHTKNVLLELTKIAVIYFFISFNAKQGGNTPKAHGCTGSVR